MACPGCSVLRSAFKEYTETDGNFRSFGTPSPLRGRSKIRLACVAALACAWGSGRQKPGVAAGKSLGLRMATALQTTCITSEFATPCSSYASSIHLPRYRTPTSPQVARSAAECAIDRRVSPPASGNAGQVGAAARRGAKGLPHQADSHRGDAGAPNPPLTCRSVAGVGGRRPPCG